MTKVKLEKVNKKGFVTMREAKTNRFVVKFNAHVGDCAERIIKLCRAQHFKLVEM